MRTRTYTATFGHTAGWQLITLAGAAFAPPENGYPGPTMSWNVISVSAFEDFASLYFEDPPIAEVLDGGSRLDIYGRASGTITQPRTELPITGKFWMRDECPAERLTLLRME